MLDSYPKIKKTLHYILMHPYTSRPRFWTRCIVQPFFITRGKGSILRRKARLDLIPSKKLVLGYRAIIEDYAIINNGMGDILIGDYSKVLSRTTIVGPVTIGKKVVIGNGTQVVGIIHNYNMSHNIPIDDQGVTAIPTIIADDVWIGGNSVINQGVTIGTHSLIGAGSVVTRDIPPYSIAVGNPARVIKSYNFETKNWEKI